MSKDDPKILGEVTFEEIYSIFQSTIVNEIDLEKDFEETGGDSLAMMQIVQLLKNEYHVSIQMDRFYKTASVKELIDEIMVTIVSNLCQKEKKRVVETCVNGQDEKTDQNRDDRIEVQEHPIYTADLVNMTFTRNEPEVVLLTGVTGFVGAHLLKELLANTKAKIYCLVRDREGVNAEERCQKRLQFYFGSELDSVFNNRVFILTGNLVEPDLSFGEQRYHTLAEEVDTIIHSAADVRHFGKYSSLEESNINGTCHLLEWAFVGRKKIFHHISTLAVAGYHPERRPLREMELEIGQNFEGNVYAESKFDSELLVTQARKRGLQASIFRLGNIVGRESDGLFQQNIETNLFYSLMKGIVLVGKMSPTFLSEAKLELIPIDLCSQLVVQLMIQKELQGATFHITNPHGITIQELCQFINQSGGSIEIIDEQAFYEYVHQVVAKQNFQQEVSWIINAMRGKNDADEDDRSMEYDATFTFSVLDKIGFIWPELEQDFMDCLLRHCEEIGYFTL